MGQAGQTVLLVLCNAPDRGVADAIAQGLVAANAAACVNILGPCRSVYRWEGEVVNAEEVPLLVKTVQDRLGEVRDIITGLHPDEVPEIIATPISAGLPAYLGFVRETCGSAGGPG